MNGTPADDLPSFPWAWNLPDLFQRGDLISDSRIDAGHSPTIPAVGVRLPRSLSHVTVVKEGYIAWTPRLLGCINQVCRAQADNCLEF